MVNDYIHNFSSTYSSYALGNTNAQYESDRVTSPESGDEGWQPKSSTKSFFSEGLRDVLVDHDELAGELQTVNVNK